MRAALGFGRLGSLARMNVQARNPKRGMLDGADELSNKPAVIDVPRGKGHVILMSTNPMWRMNTSGLYALVMNAIIEMAGAQ